MPKKHTPGYQSTKPKAVSHASLATRSRAISEGSRPETVNDRLAQLRVSQRTATKTPSPPDPALPSVLSEPNGPQRLLIQNVRRSGRLAGPAPPRSWIDPRTVTTGLESSRHAPKKSKDEVDFGTITYHPPPSLPDQPLPEARSLRATALRVLARTLSKQIERDRYMVYDLTSRMKCELVAMMAASTPRISAKLNQEKLLYLFGPMLEDDGSWVSGGEAVTHLSLGPVIGVSTDYTHLAKNLRRDSPIGQEETPDSWEDAEGDDIIAGHFLGEEFDGAGDANDDVVQDNIPSLPASMWLPLLPSLTHLSLAHPASPCWSSLLEVGVLDCLSNLTHLDLSYWPAPGLRFLTHPGKLTAFQAELAREEAQQNNEKEGIRVLNRLGKACRKLVWLGLEGCESWLACLTIIYQKPNPRPRSRFDMDDTSYKDDAIRVEWTGAWRGLKSVKVIQSWVPLPFVPPSIMAEDSRVQTHPAPNSSFMQWWIQERRVREMENLVAEWRLEAGLAAVRFEKTPVQPWIEVEIRALDARQAVMHWKNNPDIPDIDITW